MDKNPAANKPFEDMQSPTFYINAQDRRMSLGLNAAGRRAPSLRRDPCATVAFRPLYLARPAIVRPLRRAEIIKGVSNLKKISA